ncbi:tetratricopeptide repeat protein [Ramlibacter alkalitolerans]|jgi:tetratricopeptide (TPR) repeat protein|uniref:Tetratricopeptide repeat protein n=1 Tax=Ramlibacter alkalitolerans TaxID=2039631 RepID=A0ABS1JQH5_9BURK|nr:tetratricopeptide repeat protein [Ramlibacter alkalitolerans]MBL0426497.1 tetratricopeptide repeat protein [Ramlibacter alkalitolerans]
MKLPVLALICSAALAWPLTAPAAGGGGGDEMASPARNQDPEFQAGMEAVRRKDWQEVVVRMDSYIKRKPDDANAWTELGHAHRLTGKLDLSLAAYESALKIDPKHRGAHEYLGEAYLQMGDVARAEQELKVLDKLCFFSCEEYRDLKAKIGDYRKTKHVSSGS